MQEVPLVPDQGAVQQLTPAGPYPTFHHSIHARNPDAAEYETAAAKSHMLGAHFAQAAAAVGAKLLDLDGVVRYADADPIHLDAAGHHALAAALEPLVRRLAPA